MSISKNIEHISPLPVVNLDDIAPPADGLLVSAPSSCAKYFAAGDRCTNHYKKLATSHEYGKLEQCPFGFASCALRKGAMHIAFTGLVPWPRLGGDQERRMGKLHPDSKISISAIDKAVQQVSASIVAISVLERDTIKRQSVALHEIRKLNAKVKQSAERLCREQNPSDPDLADSRLVQIWKSSELMSRQFEVIELLANEDLAALPLKTQSEIYRIFDKCVRIYGVMEDHSNRLHLNAPFGYSGKIHACDKTLPIIPSALIENALKYSIAGTPINISLSSEGGNCVIRITNQSKANDKLDNRVFEKGFRLSSDHEGTGNGLHLVKIVAQQHKGKASVSVKQKHDIDEVTFIITLPEYREPSTIPKN